MSTTSISSRSRSQFVAVVENKVKMVANGKKESDMTLTVLGCGLFLIQFTTCSQSKQSTTRLTTWNICRYHGNSNPLWNPFLPHRSPIVHSNLSTIIRHLNTSRNTSSSSLPLHSMCPQPPERKEDTDSSRRPPRCCRNRKKRQCESLPPSRCHPTGLQTIYGSRYPKGNRNA